MSTYKKELRLLQIDLVRFQRHLIEHGHRVLIILEGRDSSGKDGVIKRFTEHLSPRETRVVALGRPSGRDLDAWYFQRYVPHLPVRGETVLFNRSWYNRAGVERVMGFCDADEYAAFMTDVVTFESLLVDAGIQLFKFYLDISRAEQTRRLAARRTDPLKQWKSSPIDAVALEHWDDYSVARDAMLSATDHDRAPWLVVSADDKKRTRLNLMRWFLAHVECPDRAEHDASPDADVVAAYGDPDRRFGLAP